MTAHVGPTGFSCPRQSVEVSRCSRGRLVPCPEHGRDGCPAPESADCRAPGYAHDWIEMGDHLRCRICYARRPEYTDRPWVCGDPCPDRTPTPENADTLAAGR